MPLIFLHSFVPLQGFERVFPFNFIILLHFVGLMNIFMNSQVLKALIHRDQALFEKHLDLESALVWVYFHSNVKELKHVAASFTI